MELDAFTRDLGRSQGRVTSPGSDGRAILVLGDLDSRRVAELTPGDFVQVEQAVDLTNERIVLARGSVSVPKGLAARLAWEVSIRVGEVSLARVRVRAGQTKSVDDMIANVARIYGVQTVALRLELIEGA